VPITPEHPPANADRPRIAANIYPYDQKTVLVTGTGTGIGRAIARAFLEQGANVVVCGRTPETLRETISDFPAERTHVVPGDVTVRADVQSIVQQTIDRFGSLDVLISNAGAWFGGLIDDLADGEWRRLISTNLDSFYYLVQAALPHVLASSGNIVAISSVAGLRGDWNQAAYNATKGALNTMVQSLALDLGGRGVRVNAIAPAFTLTQLTIERLSTPELLAPYNNRIGLGRPAEPEDIARATLFIASPDAGYITGVILPVDGGTSASSGTPHIE
jgi:meso-butanediol dehydrogenase / (S,S)-butanediol dehydrogenase / diacetyl reductase